MAASDESTRTGVPQRDEWELFDRARNTAVELVRLVLTLATGTIAALSVEAMREPRLHLKPNEQKVICFALAALVISVALALIGVASDATVYSNWALAIRHKEGVQGRWYRTLVVARWVRKASFVIASASFVAGIFAAGVLISMLVATP
jgi:hypothetical protein